MDAADRARLAITHVPVARLRPWPDNPRLMGEPEPEKLVRSIEKYGMVEPLVVRRFDQLVIGGHQRLEAAKAVGLDQVPVVYVELSDSEAKTLNLALNRIQGEWDLPKLGELLEELQSLPEIDETLTGFSGDEVDALLAEFERDRAPDPREESFPQAAEALQQWRERAPTRVTRGELWELGRHRLYCGDSLALRYLIPHQSNYRFRLKVCEDSGDPVDNCRVEIYGRVSGTHRQAYRAVNGVPSPFDKDKEFRLHVCTHG